MLELVILAKGVLLSWDFGLGNLLIFFFFFD
jgi:hypothetical protein